MSSDGSKFFIGYPTLRIFCEWNDEMPDDVFARYHVVDTQVNQLLTSAPLLRIKHLHRFSCTARRCIYR